MPTAPVAMVPGCSPPCRWSFFGHARPRKKSPSTRPSAWACFSFPRRVSRTPKLPSPIRSAEASSGWWVGAAFPPIRTLWASGPSRPCPKSGSSSSSRPVRGIRPRNLPTGLNAASRCFASAPRQRFPSAATCVHFRPGPSFIRGCSLRGSFRGFTRTCTARNSRRSSRSFTSAIRRIRNLPGS